ncbi:hypothetical protein [Halobacteriovorax sp. JY17]|uniref:hypothetical protein n=1 Tax=Halobacteriovorax sp. JY17 TaxID=2014617 RepID=UPI000C4604A5|nr:hypothetical protein [Halobacteriovorax sp. JY17]PIK15110.1 MAG: hypothetical protein CES88_12315 [Halobacteriovorax sp. JY17]
MSAVLAFEISTKYQDRISNYLYKIDRDSEWISDNNGHCTNREGPHINRWTISHNYINEFYEVVCAFFTYSPSGKYEQLYYEVVREESGEIGLTMKYGELNEETIEIIIGEMRQVQSRFRTHARDRQNYLKMTKEEKAEKGGPNRNNMCGLYLWRGEINSSHKHWKNYQRAIDLNFSSTLMVTMMKEWKIHLQDINF